ncbi:CCA tRNA nucleotidyltransferase [Prochlorococcus marinus]|uniref:tRNA nucleotidyltransferase/poly(A) polymerase n=1 Tax=Prochlorococcus marinus (strain MIT 9211) TaxID=93059 RepID=A9BDV0_PROM4|nr:CCA tRNA nucleotidyltransferase [Prochlorococcus marinus]ABX08260.1 tRNA nucleotidyltransferase/poly(A) polymerase [Prochlorococcus marinus str. MIT 9211]
MKPANPDFLNEFPGLPRDFLTVLRRAAKNVGIKRVAIVGGILRDHIIHSFEKEPLTKFEDIDLVIEGPVKELATQIRLILGSDKVIITRESSSFKTIQLKIGDTLFDFSTARTESYSAPGENPQVFNCNIEEDLIRRDFPINAMALELINNTFIDIFQGREDISKRKLKFMHSKSVSDDPTRIIRGARYASRLNFILDDESLKQIKSTIKLWPWDWRPDEPLSKAPPALSTRLRMELELLLEKEPWEQALQLLQDWEALSLLDTQIQIDKNWHQRILKASQLGIPPLTALVAGAKDPCSLAARLQLGNYQQTCLSQAINIKEYFTYLAQSKEYLSWLPSNWCNAIESRNWYPESIGIAISLETPLWEYCLRWLSEWRKIESKITAKELLTQGWTEGPKLGKELQRLRAETLDKGISNSETS